MADLLVISFPTEAQAEEARTRVASMQREYLIELGDAVVALRKPDGSIKLNQTFHPTAAGAAAGAVSGRLTDVGINDTFMKEVVQSLQGGEAALFLLVRKMTAERVMEGLQGMGGKIMRTSFDETKEATLHEALAGANAAGG